MKEKLLIIDGHNLLFQMFYGMPNPIVGKNGKNVEGVWGFTGALLKIIRELNPTNVLVIFDGEQKVSRKNIREDYKKNRINYEMVEETKNPFSVLKEIYEVLDYLHIKHFESFDGLEADDFIAGYCQKYHQKFDIIISSHDYDFISLVSESVSLLTYKGKSSKIYTPESVLKRWKIKPEYFADYKALVGDVSDNIAGIPRVGPKLASFLITNFGHVEEIIKNKQQIPKENVRLTLDIFEKELLENLALIRFQTYDLLPVDIEETKWINQETKTKDILNVVGII